MYLHYETATQDDVETIYLLCCSLIRSYENLDSIDYTKVLVWVKNKIQNNISQYSRVVHDGSIVAYYRFYKEGDCMELDDLYVLPQFRNIGIGGTIVTKCKDESKLPIFFYVFTENTRAVSFYKRHGFVVDRYVSPTRCIMISKT